MVASTPRTQQIMHIANHFCAVLLLSRNTLAHRDNHPLFRSLSKLADLPNSVERKLTLASTTNAHTYTLLRFLKTIETV